MARRILSPDQKSRIDAQTRVNVAAVQVGDDSVEVIGDQPSEEVGLESILLVDFHREGRRSPRASQDWGRGRRSILSERLPFWM